MGAHSDIPKETTAGTSRLEGPPVWSERTFLCTGMQPSEGDASERFGDLSFRSMTQIFQFPREMKRLRKAPLQVY